MKFIFFGSPLFSEIILNKLIKSNYAPLAVVCNPDRPTGRKKIITPPPVKILAEKNKDLNIKIIQPENILSAQPALLNFNPDIFIVASYSKIIPKSIFEIPKIGTIGVHPSLLPKYRGASPIQSAILNNEKETGVSLYLMDEKMDNGPIIIQNHLTITDKDGYETLLEKLADLSAELLIKILPDIEEKIKNAKPQKKEEATFTKKFETKDAFVELKDLENAQNQGGDLAIKIERKIKALNPEPGIWTIKENKRMKILKADLNPEKKLIIKKIQIEGKKPIDI